MWVEKRGFCFFFSAFCFLSSVFRFPFFSFLFSVFSFQFSIFWFPFCAGLVLFSVRGKAVVLFLFLCFLFSVFGFQFSIFSFLFSVFRRSGRWVRQMFSVSGEAGVARWKMEPLEHKPWYFSRKQQNKRFPLIGRGIVLAVVLLVVFAALRSVLTRNCKMIPE